KKLCSTGILPVGPMGNLPVDGFVPYSHSHFTKTLYNPWQPPRPSHTTPPLHHSNTPSFQDPMELNHILLFTAIATSALVVLQAFQPQSPGARARAAVVLIASVLAWLQARPIAGWLSAIVWCALLVVPAFLQNRAWATRYQYRPFGSDRRFGITVSPVVLALIIVNVAV